MKRMSLPSSRALANWKFPSKSRTSTVDSPAGLATSAVSRVIFWRWVQSLFHQASSACSEAGEQEGCGGDGGENRGGWIEEAVRHGGWRWVLEIGPAAEGDAHVAVVGIGLFDERNRHIDGAVVSVRGPECACPRRRWRGRCVSSGRAADRRFRPIPASAKAWNRHSSAGLPVKCRPCR